MLGVLLAAVVSFTWNKKDVPGGARYGLTVPFVRAMGLVDRSVKLWTGMGSFCASSAPVDMAAARTIAMRKTTTRFSANLRSFRSPSQYGTTNVLTGMRRMTRQASGLSVRMYSSATMTPRRTRYVIRNHTVARNFWNHVRRETRTSSRVTGRGDAGA